jgi:hypothetical protein
MKRGYNILTGEKLEGEGSQIKLEQLNKKGENKTWGRILSNSSGQEGIEE